MPRSSVELMDTGLMEVIAKVGTLLKDANHILRREGAYLGTVPVYLEEEIIGYLNPTEEWVMYERAVEHKTGIPKDDAAHE